MSPFINFNGDIVPAESPVVRPQNRAFRYGEGLFETMLVYKGSIQLRSFHFERLFQGIKILEFNSPSRLTVDYLTEQALTLCRKNENENFARVRLQVFRGTGDPEDPKDLPQFIIESFALNSSVREFNEKALTIGLFPHGKKPMDKFSNLKTCNYLLYAMAGRFARKMNWDDSFVCNTSDRICDSSIANVFCIKDKIIYTPALEEGCIAGVMRRYLFDSLPVLGITITEAKIDAQFLLEADEIFLTNAIRGLVCVERFQSKEFTKVICREIFNNLIKNNSRLFTL